MKIPGIGEMSNKQVGTAAAIAVGLGFYLWYRRRKTNQAATAAAQAATGTTAAAGAIDPNTGLPYSQEGGYGGISAYGGIDPSTGYPYALESGSGASTSVNAGLATNDQWVQQAIGDAQTVFGFSGDIAQSAIGKYIAQDPTGLNTQEYECVQRVVAELGPPPQGGPYRMIHATTPVTVPPTTVNPPGRLGPHPPSVYKPVPAGPGGTPGTVTSPVIPFKG